VSEHTESPTAATPIPDVPQAESAQVHPGWGDVPDAAYELADSGGWGTPGEHLTGPIPTLRRAEPDAEAPPADAG
jgi:hypothetical protein